MTTPTRDPAGDAVRTDPHADDPRRTGRTYAIPFERVWSTALRLAGGGLSRWALASADDEAGVIEATCTTLVFRFVDDVRVDIGLDDDAQTRVDVAWTTRSGAPALGRGARTIGRFLKALDAGLEATEAQVLDARRRPTWSA